MLPEQMFRYRASLRAERHCGALVPINISLLWSEN
jgi:hypothetical protein